MTGLALPASSRISKLSKIKASTVLYRNHHKDFGGAAFNPCLGDVSRFAPIRTPSGVCIPTFYAATTFDAAAYETVFREPPGPFAAYPRHKLQSRSVSRIAPKADLYLVPFFTPEHGGFGLKELDVFHPSETVYGCCRSHAEMTWRDNPGAHGIIWSSVRDSNANAMVLFGDRLNPDDFEILNIRLVATDVTLLDEFSEAADRSGAFISK